MMDFIEYKMSMVSEHKEEHILTQIGRCATTMRDESTIVIEKAVLADVDILKEIETHPELKDEIKVMFYTKSFYHIRAICQAYLKDVGLPVHHLIAHHYKNNAFVLLNIINYSLNPVQYFVETFRKMVKGNIYQYLFPLNFIILLRCEYDMVIIKREFERTTGRSMREAIRSTTSGPYKHALYHLIGETRTNKN